MTTLTVPGGVPEGRPGTGGPRPKDPGGPGKGGAGVGPANVARGKNRGRGNRNRHGPKPESTPGNEAPRTVEPKPDEDFNR
jgi:hypothetical protein